MKQRLLLTAMAVLVVTASSAAADVRVQYVGNAYKQDTGDLVYQEVHTMRLDGTRPVALETVYQDAEGKPFAHRQVAYGEEPAQPEFEFTDDRTGYSEGVRQEGSNKIVFKHKKGERDQAKVKYSRRPMVIDAGFDRFVVENWAQLQRGKTLKFDFLNADRLSKIALRLSKTGDRQTEFGPASEFQMEINNFVLRMFLDPIKICYLNADRSLFEYEGISNVKNPEGENYLVRIEFPPALRVALADSAAAAAAE